MAILRKFRGENLAQHIVGLEVERTFSKSKFFARFTVQHLRNVHQIGT